MNTQIWIAIHTPFFEDGTIDEAGVRANIDAFVERGIDGIFCNGLMGENWAVPLDERIEIVKMIIDQAAGRIKVCAVATLDTEEETIALGKTYKDLGMDYVCLSTPAEAQEKDEIVAYFNRLMDAIDMPTVIFNRITLKGSILNAEIFEEMNKNPHLKILKTTASDEVNNSMRKVARPDVMVSDPTEEKFWVNATEQGQRILFADPEPYLYQTPDFRPIAKYIELIEEGDLETAKKIFDALEPLRVNYNKWLMIPFYKDIMTMAYLKKWAELNGMVGGYVRKPLVPLTAEEDAQMTKEIKEAQAAVREALKGIV